MAPDLSTLRYLAGALIAGLVVAVADLALEIFMGNSFYKKNRRFFYGQPREHYVMVTPRERGYQVWGCMPHVYIVSRSATWVPRHHMAVVRTFVKTYGQNAANVIVGKLPKQWWIELDDYLEHISVLASLEGDALWLWFFDKYIEGPYRWVFIEYDHYESAGLRGPDETHP